MNSMLLRWTECLVYPYCETVDNFEMFRSGWLYNVVLMRISDKMQVLCEHIKYSLCVDNLQLLYFYITVWKMKYYRYGHKPTWSILKR